MRERHDLMEAEWQVIALALQAPQRPAGRWSLGPERDFLGVAYGYPMAGFAAPLRSVYYLL